MIAAVASWLLCAGAALQDPRPALTDRILAPVPAATIAAELQREAWLERGEADELLRALEAACADQAEVVARARHFEVLAELQFREGLLARAVESAREAAAGEETVDRLFLQARLLDALDRADDALRVYARLRELAEDPALRALVDRRVALIEAIRRAGAPASGDADPEAPSPLFALVSAEGADDAARSRAAVVLAMLGRPAEAIRLYPARGEGSARFRREIRLAEWALAAKDPAAAQEHAWQARAHAATRRDRLYALAVLSEAHRADASLGALIDRFAAEPELDAESRLAWIDLLRETARVDEALALFAAGAQGGFDPEMRRLLLDICREAGREEELVAAYEELIAAEPATLEWREGLSRHWLERGRSAEARAVWEDLLAGAGDAARLLEVAEAAAALGLDDLARACAERSLGNGEAGLQARLFLFDFELRRGRVDAAQRELDAFDREAEPRAPARVELAEAYERIGLKRRAVEILEGLRAGRGGDQAEEDLDMRLAWLLSETGDEERALELWRALWRSVKSAPRRGQVEDRLLATASRLGVIADLAVELEEKLADGKADERDASLLVRLYQKVGDPVSAAEILEEHLKQLGSDPVSTLTEKARVYLAGRDYYHFERSVRQLIDLDPEHRDDHLRQLAMSMLERGKPHEARAVLVDLARSESPSDAAEFEAGVLSLAKLDAEAVLVYRKGIAAHPGRIDSYLLLADAMRRTGDAERATGMFQFLVETAEQDDLFTVAVDGVLNMRARPPALRWTLRAILERLAARDDRTYLFQLCADLSEELEDNELRMRALEASLPIAGEQRAAILRELMDLALGRSLNSYTVVNGRLVPMRSGGDGARRLAYGRRLIGLGDAVPPDVYLELGEAFLASGEVSNAAKTFDLARDLPDWVAFQRQVAASFENARYVSHALAIYERLLATAGTEPGLLLKAGELHEQLGADERAAGLYRRGIELLLERFPLAAAEVAERAEDREDRWRPRNVNEQDVLFPVLEAGFLTAATEAESRAFASDQRARLEADLAELRADAGGSPTALAGHPRVRVRAEWLRRLALAWAWLEEADAIDLALMNHFPGDGTLLAAACAERAAGGYAAAAARLAERSGRPEAERAAALAGAGLGSRAESRGPLPPAEAVRALLPLLLDGRLTEAARMLRSVDLRGGDPEALPALHQLLSAASFLDDPHLAVQLAQATLGMLAAKDSDYEDANAADALLKRLRPGLDGPSFDLVVDGYVTELLGDADADAFVNHLRVLVRLRRDLGRDLIDPEILREKIEACLPDRAYVLTNLLGLAAPDLRLGLLRPVWSLVPPTRRCSIAINLLGLEAPEPDEAFADFLVQSFLDGLDDVEDVSSFSYAIERAVYAGGALLPYYEPIVEALAAKEPQNALLLAQVASVRIQRGRMGAALESMSAAVAALVAAGDVEEYVHYSARRILVAGFVPENADRLLAAVKAEEGRSGDSIHLSGLRAQIFAALGDAAAERRAVEEAYRADPEDPAKMAAYYRELASSGEIPGSMALLEKLAETEGDGENWRQELHGRWLGLGNPVRALAERAKLPGAAEPAGEADRRLEEPDQQRVRAAAEEGRLADARAEYRRTWRQFGQADQANSMFRISYRTFGGRWTMPWPVPQPDAEGGDPPREEPKTGLAGWGIDRDPLQPVEQPPVRTFYEALATFEFGRDELRRQYRRMAPGEVAGSAPLLQGVQLAAVAEAGADAARAAWLATIREGRDGARERAVYLSFLERNAQALTAEERAAFESLAAQVEAQDAQSLRAVARVRAALGEPERAERIYQWLASLATTASWMPAGETAVSVYELLEEVPRVLEGEPLFRTLDAILARSDPGGSMWERSSFFNTSLRAWLGVAPPALARERCAAILAEVADRDRGLLREPALPAARILADCGQHAEALQLLETALCRFDPGETGHPEEDWYDLEDALRAPHQGHWALLLVFPGGSGRAPPAPEWLDLAAEAALLWNDTGRLHPGTARALLLLLAARLHEGGRGEAARPLLDTFWSVPERSPEERLIAADLERLLGGAPRADAEEEALLAEWALNRHRVPAVLRRIAAARGPAAALADGERYAEWITHRPVLEALVALAEEAGAPERAAHWRATIEQFAAAAAELEIEW